MLELTLQSSRGSSFLHRRRYASFHIRLAASELSSPIPVSRLVEDLLTHAPELIPSLASAEFREENGQTVFLVHNMRGRPMESFDAATAVPTRRNGATRHEELFHSNGSVFVLPKSLDRYPEENTSLEEVPFSFELFSEFDHFDQKGNIIHRLRPQSEQLGVEQFADLNLKRITQLAPLRIDQVRLGFELYQPKFMGSSFGRIPDIKKRLFLEVTSTRIYLFIEETGLRSKDDLPFETGGSLSSIANSLERYGLFSGLLETLREAP